MSIYAIYYRFYVIKADKFETIEDAILHLQWGAEDGSLVGIGVYDSEANTIIRTGTMDEQGAIQSVQDKFNVIPKIIGTFPTFLE